MRRTPDTYTILEGSIIRETDKAVRFSVEMPGHPLDDETFWFPFSQIRKLVRSHDMGLDQMEVKDWLIEAKANEIAGAGNSGTGD